MVNRENRRYGRIKIAKGLRVAMRSIGSEISYNMETHNVSDTGFFLNFEKPGRFPFTPASIMEVWLELEHEQTIFFNGKMTRVVYPEEASADNEAGIAIKIVQIEKDEESALRDFIRNKAIENETKNRTNTSIPSSVNNETGKKVRSKKIVNKKTASKKIASKKITSKKTTKKTVTELPTPPIDKAS